MNGVGVNANIGEAEGDLKGIAQRTVLLFLVWAGVAAGQTTYYVSPSGSDGSSGTSSSSAWRTVAKVNASSFNPGDRILFERAGTWRETLIPRSSGSAGSPIEFGAYGTGGRPILTVVVTYPAGEWSDQGNNIWAHSQSGHPNRVKIGGVEYGTTRTSRSNIDDTWRWYWESDALYVRSSGAPEVEISGGGNALRISDVDHVTFTDLDFRGGSTCVNINGSDYVTFTSCNIGDFVGSYGLWSVNSSFGVVSNCNVDRRDFIMYTFNPDYGGYTFGGHDCIALRDGSSYWDIHDNYIAGFGHDGVAIGTQYTAGADCIGIQVHKNEFRGGNDYCRAINIHGTYPGRDCRIYSNYAHDCTEQWQLSGIDNWVYYNLIDTVRVCTWYGPQHWYQSAGLAGSDGTCRGLRIFNNTLRNVDGAGIRLQYPWQDPYVENNIIYNTGREWRGSTTDYNFYQVGIEVEANSPTLTSPWTIRTGGTIRNNIIYGTADGNRAIIWEGASNQGAPISNKISPEELNRKSGTNGMVASGNRFIDPLLQADMKVGAGSPAVDAGVSHSISRDFWGTAVPTGGGVDIGAYEWVSGGGGTTQPIPAPALVSPSDGSLSLSGPVELRWNSVNGASGYRLQVSSSRVFDTALLDSLVNGTSVTLSAPTPSSTYYWHVRASGPAGSGAFSSSWSFTSANTSSNLTGTDISAEGTPAALVTAPLGSGSKSLEVIRDGVIPPAGSNNPLQQYDTWTGELRTFEWVGYTFASRRTFTGLRFQEGIRYQPVGGWFAELRVQVLSGGVWSDVQSLKSDPQYGASSGASFGVYDLSFARVSGEGIRIAGVPGGTKTYISVGELRVLGEGTTSSPGVPRILAPLADARNIPLTTTIRWSASGGAISYHLQLSSDPQFSSFVRNDSLLTDTLLTVGPLSAGTGYFTRVRVRNGSLWSAFSSSAFFVTVEDSKPSLQAPALATPQDKSVVQVPKVTLTWKTVSGATGYHVQIASDVSFTKISADTIVAPGSLMFNSPKTEVTYFWRVQARDQTGFYTYSQPWSFTVDEPRSVELTQNYPNPFNPATAIRFHLDRDRFVELKVYSVLGQEVATLVAGMRSKGTHEVIFDAAKSGSGGLATGVYLYRLNVDDYVEIRKMLYTK